MVNPTFARGTLYTTLVRMTIFRADSAIKWHNKVEKLGRKFGNKKNQKVKRSYTEIEDPK